MLWFLKVICLQQPQIYSNWAIKKVQNIGLIGLFIELSERSIMELFLRKQLMDFSRYSFFLQKSSIIDVWQDPTRASGPQSRGVVVFLQFLGLALSRVMVRLVCFYCKETGFSWDWLLLAIFYHCYFQRIFVGCALAISGNLLISISMNIQVIYSVFV